MIMCCWLYILVRDTLTSRSSYLGVHAIKKFFKNSFICQNTSCNLVGHVPIRYKHKVNHDALVPDSLSRDGRYICTGWAAGDVGVMNISISSCRHNPVIAGLRHKPGTVEAGTMIRWDRYKHLQTHRTEQTMRFHVISWHEGLNKKK